MRTSLRLREPARSARIGDLFARTSIKLLSLAGLCLGSLPIAIAVVLFVSLINSDLALRRATALNAVPVVVQHKGHWILGLAAAIAAIAAGYRTIRLRDVDLIWQSGENTVAHLHGLSDRILGGSPTRGRYLLAGATAVLLPAAIGLVGGMLTYAGAAWLGEINAARPDTRDARLLGATAGAFGGFAVFCGLLDVSMMFVKEARKRRLRAHEADPV